MLDVRTAAAELGVSEKTIRTRAARRLLPFRRFGGRLLFLRDELDQFFRALDGCDLDEARRNLARRAEE